MPTSIDAASGNPFPGGSQAANDLGLGDVLQNKMLDEDEKRKQLMQKNTNSIGGFGGQGILSPASLALLGGAKY